MNKITLEEVRQRGFERGQEFLDTEWRGMQAKANWRCLACHTVRLQASRVILLQTREGTTGCPRCRTTGNRQHADRKRQERVDALLLERGGGQCVDGLPPSSNARVRWQCARSDHPPFSATLEELIGGREGRWCPRCTDRAGESYGEALCRSVLEQIFERPFLRRRNLPGGITELDCHNEELLVSLEHHGEQHYRRISYFHPTPEDFADQQKRDAEKVRACHARGHTLVIVPSVPTRTKPEDLRAFIVGELRRLGCLHLLADAETRPIDLTRIFRPDPRGRFAELEAAAGSVGLTLDEPDWMGASHHYTLRCSERSHPPISRTAALFLYRVRKGERGGCRACSGSIAYEEHRKPFSELVAAAAERGYIILSTEAEIYATRDARCTIQCERCVTARRCPVKATKEISRRALLGGRYGCTACAGRAQLTPENIRARVERRNWYLEELPEGAINNRTRVTVHCERNHTFKKIAHALDASGCPACPNARGRSGHSNRRLTSEQATQAAAKAGWILFDPSVFKNTKTAICYRCARCDFEVTTTHAQMLHRRCPRCPTTAV